LYLASHTGDAAAVRNIFYASNDGERQLCDCFAELLAAGGKLEEALRAKYGQGDASFAAPMMTQSDLAKLDSAKLEEDGDSAQLTPAGESRPMKFKRVDGQWKLIVSDYAGATKENLPEQIETLTSMARVFEGAAADVAAGKYPNASDAEAGIQQKLYDLIVAAVQKTPPTSAPATRP
jgi:hypothetical protein